MTRCAGDYISYDAKTEFFQVIGSGKAATSPSDPKARVHAIIQPKRKPAPRRDSYRRDTPDGTTLKPSAEIGRPRKP